MILVIDIGNSNITFGIFKEYELLLSFRLNSNSSLSEESYSLDIFENFLNNNQDINKIDKVIIASVVPILTSKIRLAISRISLSEILIIGENNFEIDIETSLKNRAEIGVDRLINSFFSFKKYGGNIVIIDFGTATTFDVVNDSGIYIGGIIAPGVNLSIKTLHEMTAKLPNINLQKPNNVIGKSTKEAMQSGIYYGYISLIEGLLEKIKAEYGKDLKIIITGGLANLFAKEIKADIVDENLTLKGIASLKYGN